MALSSVPLGLASVSVAPSAPGAGAAGVVLVLTPATDSALMLPVLVAVIATSSAVIPALTAAAAVAAVPASSPDASPTRARVSNSTSLSAPATPTEPTVLVSPVPSALVIAIEPPTAQISRLVSASIPSLPVPRSIRASLLIVARVMPSIALVAKVPEPLLPLALPACGASVMALIADFASTSTETAPVPALRSTVTPLPIPATVLAVIPV